MIGKVYLSQVDFYDVRIKAMGRKARPVLIVGGPYENDYIVLPISTISRRENLNPHYDLPISPQERMTLNLTRECFIRTHKQMTVHRAALIKELGDMKQFIPELYLKTLAKWKNFRSKSLIALFELRSSQC